MNNGSTIEVDLLRHVKVNGAAALYGHTNIAPQLEQNEKLLAALIQVHQQSPYDLVVSSPLQRCQILAEHFSKTCQVPLVCLSDFKEMDFGDVDGIPFEQLSPSPQSNNENWLLLERFWQAPNDVTLPNGESLSKFRQRVISSWNNLISQQGINLSKKNKSLKILVLTHGGVIRMILSHLLPLNWQCASLQQHLQVANASKTKITISCPFPDKKKTHSVVNYIGLPMLPAVD